MKLCDGIYAYTWRGVFENNCNMYYFGDPLNILFDPGLVRHLDLRFENMRKDAIDIDSIEYVIATHSHPDHFEGCDYFMKKNTPVGMHRDEISFVNEIGPKFFAMMGMPFPQMSFKLVMDEGVLSIGDVNLDIYLTPGHSPGSICVYWKEKKALICGDLVFKESVGRVDFPGGDPKKLKESIEKIAALDVEYLLPGHMELIQGADNVKKNFDLIRRYVFPVI